MKLFKTKLRVLALAVGSLAISVLSANAQSNPNYAPGDLVLFFQKFGDTNTVYANLGSAASFRGAATGAADAVNQIDFLTINTTLVSAFGAGWATDTSIYAGLAGCWNDDNTTEDLLAGDPSRTLYVSSARTAVGSSGPNSGGYSILGNTAKTGIAAGMMAQNNVLEDNYIVAQTVSPTSVSKIADYNPLDTVSDQGTAFDYIGGGVQQRGGSFAASFGDAGDSVFALDLYRIQSMNTITGQVGLGELKGEGTYEGTVTIGSAGNVSFSTVPEPSTYALLGMSALVIGYVIRRRRAQNL